MDFVVREAVIEDLEEIVKLWRQLSIGQMEKDPYYSGSLVFQGGETQFKHSIESSDCGLFIIEYDEKIQGFIEVWKDVKPYYFENENCAYIVHCIYDNQSKNLEKSIVHMIASLYYAAENWAKAQGKSYLTADVFQHNLKVVNLLKRAGLKPFKVRCVRKI